VGTVKEWICGEVGSVPYAEAWHVQRSLVEARQRAGGPPDLLLLLEHPPVFTLGRRGGSEFLTVSEAFLEQRGVPLFHVERGGFVTYHGPGQLVGYPVVDLRANGWKVVDFAAALEEVMIRTAGDWGIKAHRDPRNRGVWVGPKKLGSVGIAVRRWVSYHGFALNVNTDLEPFGWVHPCGLVGVTMTSIAELLGRELPMADVGTALKRHVEEIFGVVLRPGTWQEIRAMAAGRPAVDAAL
jgi:lipoate-protein ligase B